MELVKFGIVGKGGLIFLVMSAIIGNGNGAAVGSGRPEVRNEIETESLFRVQYKTIPMTSFLASLLSIEFIKHASHMRRQIPCSFNDLVRFAEEEKKKKEQSRKRRRLTAGFHKKAHKFVTDILCVFDGIRTVFSELRPKKILILCGGSAASPREGFMLNIEYTEKGDLGGGLEYTYTDKQCGLAVRKLVRSLFLEGARVFQSEIRPLKLFFFVYGRRVDDCSRLGGFLPKENFKVNTKSRRSRAPFEISISGLQSVDEELEDEMYGEDPMENMWYGWPRGVTGLRSPPDRKK